ncbi:hypothetical protein [Fulvivirga ligni]|uniref:hypothetical protein n=1 Tax=Fulvivirga ligni TaxID=2904246 RepID=UPI001F212E27|nr:hypothetical protein [Fulvivirga ligni]UII20158.1 hypothetical protein LVD16_20130 [Fulvivirga ligni]
MKKCLLVALFALISFVSKSQDMAKATLSYNSVNATQTSIQLAPPANVLEDQYSLAHYNKMMAERKHPLVKTGKILTFIGIPLAVIGAIMVADADSLSYECYNGDCEGDASGAFGVIFLAAGVGMTGTGIVLWTIGNKKSK